MNELNKKIIIILFIFINSILFFTLSVKSFNYDIVGNKLNKYFDTLELKQTSFGSNFSGEIINDGNSDHLYTWGSNEFGQLGTGDTRNRNTPVEEIWLPEGKIKQISFGGTSSYAIVNYNDSDHLYAWGNNKYGQLGVGDKKDRYTPVEVTGLPRGEIKFISASQRTFYNFSLAVVNDGTNDRLYSWGDNTYGQLGTGNKESKTKPVEVTGLNRKDIKEISSGEAYSMALTTNGNIDYLYTWGHNDSGQLGLGDNEDRSTPTVVTEDSYSLNNGKSIKKISGGASHSMAIVNNGKTDSLYSWGKGKSGELGLKDKKDYYNTPQKVTSLHQGTIKQVELGSGSSSAVVNYESSDHLYSWGIGYYGQLGLGDLFQCDLPTEVTGLPEGNIKELSRGGFNSAVTFKERDSTNDLYITGNNDKGQLGLGYDGEESNVSVFTFLDFFNTVRKQKNSIGTIIIISVSASISLIMIIVASIIIYKKYRYRKWMEYVYQQEYYENYDDYDDYEEGYE